MRDHDALGRVCNSTGLWLLPATGATAWQIAKISYGPLHSMRREVTDSDFDPWRYGTGHSRLEWARYDIAGRRTIYASSPVEAEYAEALRVFRPPAYVLGDYFDASDDDDDDIMSSPTTINDVFEREWAAQDHMAPGGIPAGWRHDRMIYPITLPTAGWFVDVERTESLAAISAALPSLLAQYGYSPLAADHLRGTDREFTTRVAEWMWGQVLDDNTRLHGIRYRSDIDPTWLHWAIWLRSVDAGNDLASEPTQAGQGAQILDSEHNAPMRHTLDQFGLRLF